MSKAWSSELPWSEQSLSEQSSSEPELSAPRSSASASLRRKAPSVAWSSAASARRAPMLRPEASAWRAVSSAPRWTEPGARAHWSTASSPAPASSHPRVAPDAESAAAEEAAVAVSHGVPAEAAHAEAAAVAAEPDAVRQRGGAAVAEPDAVRQPVAAAVAALGAERQRVAAAEVPVASVRRPAAVHPLAGPSAFRRGQALPWLAP